jgi:nucleoid DNA-binding protein
MTKSELIKEIATKTNVSNKTVEDVINVAIAVSIDTVAKGDSIVIKGFGTLAPKYRKAKKARNIRSGVSIDVPAYYAPAFKPSTDFKEKVRENYPTK